MAYVEVEPAGLNHETENGVRFVTDWDLMFWSRYHFSNESKAVLHQQQSR
jgi:hypothetical protein